MRPLENDLGTSEKPISLTWLHFTQISPSIEIRISNLSPVSVISSEVEVSITLDFERQHVDHTFYEVTLQQYRFVLSGRQLSIRISVDDEYQVE